MFQRRFWEPIQRGEVTVAFRRWKRHQVVAGRVYRSPAGRLAVDSVDIVEPDAITQDDARRAGFADADAVRRELRGDDGDAVFRIEFRHLDEPDPRTELAMDDVLDADAVRSITSRLDRLDRASRHGAWTRSHLELIERHPHIRAPDLAALMGRETQAFKTDVRKLKNLGLTLSFRPGYDLSPRGRAYLSAVRAQDR